MPMKYRDSDKWVEVGFQGKGRQTPEGFRAMSRAGGGVERGWAGGCPELFVRVRAALRERPGSGRLTSPGQGRQGGASLMHSTWSDNDPLCAGLYGNVHYPRLTRSRTSSPK